VVTFATSSVFVPRLAGQKTVDLCLAPQFVSAVSYFVLRSDCKMQNAVITDPANDRGNAQTVRGTDCTACAREMNVW